MARHNDHGWYLAALHDARTAARLARFDGNSIIPDINSAVCHVDVVAAVGVDAVCVAVVTRGPGVHMADAHVVAVDGV